LSNGGMMSHRLGVELSDRIAAIASVAGTVAVEKATPGRPMPVLQIHGTEDRLVKWDGVAKFNPSNIAFRSVQQTIDFWVERNGTAKEPKIEKLADAEDDGTTAERFVYSAAGGADVELIKITDGGHAWPGRELKFLFIGRTSLDFSANEEIWRFFQKHPMP
jgi:polyhydroxybutyrate depolymerase